MKRVPLTQGKFALVDDEDYKRVSQFTWFVAKRGKTQYAARNVGRGRGNRTIRYLHQELLSIKDGSEVDHKNGDGLDNRKENLRRVSHGENNQNKGKQRGVFSSIYKGVSWHGLGLGYWRAQITVAGRKSHLGLFYSEEAAARAYDEAALDYFGAFARLNFPQP